MRHCLMLDLKDDAGLIAEYEAHHRAVWPEVADHLRSSGIISMAQAAQDDERVQAWEQLMWRFQAPTPWTPKGGKWTAAECIFEMRMRI